MIVTLGAVSVKLRDEYVDIVLGFKKVVATILQLPAADIFDYVSLTKAEPVAHDVLNGLDNEVIMSRSSHQNVKIRLNGTIGGGAG